MKTSFKSLFLLATMVAAICGIEVSVTHFFGDQTLAPLLSILCCAALIFYGSSRLILAGIPLFATLTYLLIMDSSKYPQIRTATMVLGGGLAYWACRQKQKLEKLVAETDMVLTKIDTPWILCDRSGSIRRASVSAAQLAQANLKDLMGVSFFSKFSGGHSKGELIQKFLRAADSRIAVDRVGLDLSNQSGPFLDASFIPIQTGDGTGILVILSSKTASAKS